MLGSGDMRDARAAAASEMLHRQGRAAFVVRQQAKRVGIVGLGEHVDHRQAVGERSDRRALVGAPRRDHQTVDALAEKLVEMLALARRIVGGVAHEDGDALVGQALLQRLDDREGEAAETVVGDDADRARSGAMQALCEVVGPIADLAGDRSTFSRVSCRSLPPAFSALDAVPIDTSAIRATSRMVGALRDWRVGARRQASDVRRIDLVHRSFHRAAEEAGDVVFLQQQVERHARDDRDRDARLQHAPVGAADARLRARRGQRPAAA